MMIGIDFQGWPIESMTFREILLALGFKEDSETFILRKSEDTNKLLNAYPTIMVDDGMGYGIEHGLITVVDNEVYEKNVKNIEFDDIGNVRLLNKDINTFNIFIDKQPNEKTVKQYNVEFTNDKDNIF